jgi:long-chain acyl-CoA synthetase
MREIAVPAVATIAADDNLTDPVWGNAEQDPDHVQFAIPSEGHWREVTCAQFRDQVVELAKGLIAAGLRSGDRVGLMSKTRYEWTLSDYAILAVGAVTVPIYETSSAEQVSWILSDSAAVAVIVETPAHVATVAGVRDGLPALKHVWSIDAGALRDLVGMGAGVSDADVDQRRRAVKADDIATIIYTSGTTGRPKGCVLTHRNIAFDAQNGVAGLRALFNSSTATLLFLPLAHSFARLIQFAAVQVRAKMAHTADIKHLPEILQEFRPTFVLSVPRVFEKVYNTAHQRAYASGKGAIFDRAERVAIAYSEALESGGPGIGLRLRHKLFDALVYGKIRAAFGGRCIGAISGGAPLGVRLAHFFRGIGITIYEGYGLTETSPGAAISLQHAIRIGTVGRPVPGVAIRIADDGEILIKGDIVFSGYWNNDAATGEVIDADHWFHSGDLGSLDDDGFLKITGRKKEIIVTAGGKNVAPAVLEDRLRAHPLISQCVVVGDQKPFIGALITIDEEAFPKWLADHGKPTEATVADLREDPDLRADIQQAVDEANQAVSQAEAIRVFRILPRDWTEETGEITPSLKVKRNVVIKEYADEIAAIYSNS